MMPKAIHHSIFVSFVSAQKLPNLGTERTKDPVEPEKSVEPGSFTVHGKRVAHYKRADKENVRQRSEKEKVTKSRAKRALEPSSDSTSESEEEMKTPPMRQRKKRRTKKAKVTLFKYSLIF